MMRTKFFVTANDSDSDTSSEDVPAPRQAAQPVYFSDSDDNKKRVVRPSHEKKTIELNTLIEKLRNFRKIKDFQNMLATFEELCRVYKKAVSVFIKSEMDSTPRFYVRYLVELEDYIQEIWDEKDLRKNLSKSNARNLSTLRQKLRKYVKDFEADIISYRENPSDGKGSDDEEDDDEDDDDDDDDDDDVDDEISDFDDEDALEKAVAPTLSAKDFKKSTVAESSDVKSDQESNDSFWKKDSESDSSDNAQYKTIRERFLKKSRATKADDEVLVKKKERKEKRKVVKGVDDEDDDDEEEEEDDGGEWEMVKGGTAISSVRFKMFGKDEEITPVTTVKKLEEIISYRGKKKTSRREILNMIKELHMIAIDKAMNTAIVLKIKYSLIIAIFDYNYKISEAMKSENWEKLLVQMEEFMAILLKDPFLVKFSIEEGDEEQLLDTPYLIHGRVLTITEKLDSEFTKMLKECDPHSNEYVERLKDEPRVVNIIKKTKKYLEVTEAPSEQLCLIYLRLVEHVYYKLDVKYIEQISSGHASGEKTSLDIMNHLCKYIYGNDNTDRLRTRAIMCHIYHHALHNNWYKARDLLLMSHLQETITFSDPSTQILYNRTIANLGLCAFRHGNIRDAHNCLVDLMVSGKQKELLAQGLLPQKQVERSKEQEKIEKSRQIPFHMHINLELLECVYLVSAMLIEIPYMAAHEFDARRKMISKTFYQLLRNSERQNLSGPPESMREHVVAATKAMRNGQWQQCVRFIINEKMNKKIWDLFYQADEVKNLLTRLIREESLRTYLFTYSKVYDSISMDILGSMFELDRLIVHSIISKMIINEELMASLDEPSQTVVMHRTEPSRLQSLALQLTEKASAFLDSNERILEAKQMTAMPSSRLQNAYRTNERPIYRNAAITDWARQRKTQKI